MTNWFLFQMPGKVQKQPGLEETVENTSELLLPGIEGTNLFKSQKGKCMLMEREILVSRHLFNSLLTKQHRGGYIIQRE